MGLALPEEYLPLEEPGAGDAAPAPASAPGRLILCVEGQAEADAFLAAYAAGQQQGGTQQAAGGVQLPAACAACGAAAGAGFAAAAHQPVAGFIRSSLLISTACSSCSARAVEVRSAGGVSAQGSRLRCMARQPLHAIGRFAPRRMQPWSARAVCTPLKRTHSITWPTHSPGAQAACGVAC